MIAWSPTYPPLKKAFGYLRILRARAQFYEHFILCRKHGWLVSFALQPGDHERLAALRDIHKGRRAFILGTGPSLVIEDVKRLKDEITFGCNGLYKMYPELGWTTTYQTVIDRTQLEDRAPELNRLTGVPVFVPLFAAYCIKRRPNVIYLPFRWPNSRYGYPQFSEDAAAAIWDGMTVTLTNLQLAFHMGIREVILLGIDFSYNLAQDIAHGSDTITGVEQSPDHFIKDYYSGSKRFVQFYPELQRQAYRLAASVFSKHGGRLLNASRRTCLEDVRRVDFDSLFS
jgi:hypothetical protein